MREKKGEHEGAEDAWSLDMMSKRRAYLCLVWLVHSKKSRPTPEECLDVVAVDFKRLGTCIFAVEVLGELQVTHSRVELARKCLGLHSAKLSHRVHVVHARQEEAQEFAGCALHTRKARPV